MNEKFTFVRIFYKIQIFVEFLSKIAIFIRKNIKIRKKCKDFLCALSILFDFVIFFNEFLI